MKPRQKRPYRAFLKKLLLWSVGVYFFAGILVIGLDPDRMSDTASAHKWDRITTNLFSPQRRCCQLLLTFPQNRKFYLQLVERIYGDTESLRLQIQWARAGVDITDPYQDGGGPTTWKDLSDARGGGTSNVAPQPLRK